MQHDRSVMTVIIYFLSLISVGSAKYIALGAFLSPSSSFSTSELHYSVVIDAGSSGSRAYLYAWPTHSGDPHELLQISPLTANNGNPIYKKVQPGLSRYHKSFTFLTTFDNDFDF